MRESHIESYLRTCVKARGGLCWKFTSPGLVGVPDRVVVLPTKEVVWVELKAPGEKPTPAQLRRHKELIDLGQTVLVIDSMAQVDEFIEKFLCYI